MSATRNTLEPKRRLRLRNPAACLNVRQSRFVGSNGVSHSSALNTFAFSVRKRSNSG
jgi:hypothetical protein